MLYRELPRNLRVIEEFKDAPSILGSEGVNGVIVPNFTGAPQSFIEFSKRNSVRVGPVAVPATNLEAEVRYYLGQISNIHEVDETDLKSVTDTLFQQGSLIARMTGLERIVLVLSNRWSRGKKPHVDPKPVLAGSLALDGMSTWCLLAFLGTAVNYGAFDTLGLDIKERPLHSVRIVLCLSLLLDYLSMDFTYNC